MSNQEIEGAIQKEPHNPLKGGMGFHLCRTLASAGHLDIKDVDKIGFSKSFKSIVRLFHRLLSMLFRLLITCK